MKHRIYLAGPITGNANYKERFGEVAAELAAYGHIVFNPAILPEGLGYGEYFPICFAMIEAADTVVMLPGWGDSVGAGLEYHYAKCTDKKVAFYGEASSDYLFKIGI